MTSGNPFLGNFGLGDMQGLINGNSVPNQEYDVPTSIEEIPSLDTELAKIYLSNKGSKKQPEQLVQVNGESSIIMVVEEKTFKTKFYTDKFYLQSFQESRNEKVQVIETFGDPNVTFFGERTKTYQGAGFVLEANSTNRMFPDKYRWASSLTKFYEEELRGSQLTKKGNIAILWVGNYKLFGYFLNLVLSTSATDPYKKSFSFNFLVKKQELIINDSLDTLFSIYKLLSSSERARYLSLEAVLKENVTKLDEIEKKLAFAKEYKQSADLAKTIKSLESSKSIIKSVINSAIVEMRSILSNVSNTLPELNG